MGIAYYTPEDTFYYTLSIEPSTYYGDRCQVLTKTLANCTITIDFPTGYINYRLGYTDEPDEYTYTFLNSNLNQHNATYFRTPYNQIYYNDNDLGNGEYHILVLAVVVLGKRIMKVLI